MTMDLSSRRPVQQPTCSRSIIRVVAAASRVRFRGSLLGLAFREVPHRATAQWGPGSRAEEGAD